MWKDNGKSEDFELSSNQIDELIKLAKITKNDTFYDLGSASGRVIIQIAKTENFKKAIGIEYDVKHYNKAKKMMFNFLPLNKIKKIDFWLGKFGEGDYGCYDYDISDATIIYNSLVEDEDEINFYKQQFKKKKIKILKKDVPLVGYKSEANRYNNRCWFFLHEYPLEKIKRNDWANSVLGKPSKINQVYTYYENQLKKRGTKNKHRIDEILDLKKLVNKRFN